MHSWEGDPHQQATPEYGSLDPGSDLPPDRPLDPTAACWRVLFAGVRAAGIEVDLAAMNMAKTSESAERLLAQAEGSELSQRIWALWGLGLLGNRGVEPERLTQVLVAQLQDSDPEVRHWAVEGLAYLGTDDAIAPLLQTLHDDGSRVVRERAARSLAHSGMLTQQQRC